MIWKIKFMLYGRVLNKLLLKHNFLIVLCYLSLFIYACQNEVKVSNYSILEKLIASNISSDNRTTEKEILFILADYDCEVCVNDLPLWIARGKNYNSDLNILGLYFQSGRKFTYADLIENTSTKIHWIRLSGYEIIEEIANLLPKEKGPFAITFYNRRILDVYPVNKPIYKGLFKSILPK